MFGYVTINKPELKIKDFETYRSFYCGICHALQKRHGLSARITLNYDLTFLAILLTGLYETESTVKPHRCLLHPLQPCRLMVNPLVDYAADMNVLLAYHQSMDHWKDEKKLLYGAEAVLLKKNCRHLQQKYPRQSQAVQENLQALHRAEQANSTDLDHVAGCTGAMLGELFAYCEDEWAASLRQAGFYLGKFIYLMDAWEDRTKDAQHGCYNPLNNLYPEEDCTPVAEAMLTAMMAECAKRFERLPILLHADILRNILYSGVWRKYNTLLEKQTKEN